MDVQIKQRWSGGLFPANLFYRHEKIQYLGAAQRFRAGHPNNYGPGAGRGMNRRRKD